MSAGQLLDLPLPSDQAFKPGATPGALGGPGGQPGGVSASMDGSASIGRHASHRGSSKGPLVILDPWRERLEEGGCLAIPIVGGKFQ